MRENNNNVNYAAMHNAAHTQVAYSITFVRHHSASFQHLKYQANTTSIRPLTSIPRSELQSLIKLANEPVINPDSGFQRHPGFSAPIIPISSDDMEKKLVLNPKLKKRAVQIVYRDDSQDAEQNSQLGKRTRDAEPINANDASQPTAKKGKVMPIILDAEPLSLSDQHRWQEIISAQQQRSDKIPFLDK